MIINEFTIRNAPCKTVATFAFAILIATGCASSPTKLNTLKPIEYGNIAKRGPSIIVLPGEIKVSNNEFASRMNAENIADFAEIELIKANFTVLERKEMSTIMAELQTAYGAGDSEAARQHLSKGGIESTKWIMKFDVLKAESVAEVRKSFSGSTFGKVAGFLLQGAGTIASFLPMTGAVGQLATSTGASVAKQYTPIVAEVAGKVANTVGDSIQISSESEVWAIGMRYKVIDANSARQVATGYVEQKLEIAGSQSSGIGVGASETRHNGVDGIVQRIIQMQVKEIDTKYK